MIPDQWYAVLESNEVKKGQPAAFKRLNEDLVFWRDEAGKVVVMRDLCPHRQAKLSPGKIVNGNIECPFHGFQYDNKGECQLIPANGKNGPRPKVFQAKVLPTREAHGFIWVWYGERRKEYPPIPFFEELEGFNYGTLRKEWNTHYTRAIENQLDLAHLPFVHATTIGRGGRTLIDGPYSEVDENNNSLYVWTNFKHDNGRAAIKPGQMTKPKEPWLLCFKFPNVWLNRLGGKFMIMVAFAPIDDEHTMMYVRLYHKLVKSKWLNRVISEVGARANARILKQDESVVVTQLPKQGGLDSGDQYIPADRPILLYHTHRKQLIEAANREYADFREYRVAGD